MAMKGKTSSKVATKIIRGTPKVLDGPCSFKEYKCSLPRVESYRYCIRHILNDKSAPYRQCSFTNPSTKKRCFRASPLTDRVEGFCKDHSTQAGFCRNYAMYKAMPPEGPELYLDRLSHHLVDPSSTIKHPLPDPSNVPSLASVALEYATEPEDLSIYNHPIFKSLARIDDDAEYEGLTFDEDPLENAGVYTVEEASKIYLQKMVDLRAMYKDEFKNLIEILKDGRKEYLSTLKLEKESMKIAHTAPRVSPCDRKSYDEFKAMLRYHRPSGLDALMQKRLDEKRQKVTDGLHSKPGLGGFHKCIYNEGSWKCGEKAVPMAKHCLKHILLDPHQILFMACSAKPVEGVDECEVPFIPLPHTPTCIYHTPVPDMTPLSPMPSPLVEDAPLLNVGPGSLRVTEVPPTDVMEGDR